MIETLRSAVFQRDGHKCVFCGRGQNDGAKLHAHHVYYWLDQHGNSLDELATACELCHTDANHKPGGKLWRYGKPLPRYTGAAFMNTVRWYIYNALKDMFPDVEIVITYGAATKVERQYLGLDKSHVNDAYAMGDFHPEKRAIEVHYQKRRRNNRILEKFYDAKYIDSRDGSKKTGGQLSCNRTNRREPRVSTKSLRMFRKEKASKGKRSIRKQRYSIRPGDTVRWNSNTYNAVGVHCNGKNVLLDINGKQKSVAISKVKIVKHEGAYTKI